MARTHAGSGATGERFGRVTLSRTAGFWLATVVFFLVFAVAAAPAPLYGVYQAEWKFSAIVLTAVFAIYALFLLITLLIFGSVSDHLGRRRVISVALFVNAVVCALFLTAHGVAQLFVARAGQGVAVGLASECALGDADRPATGGQRSCSRFHECRLVVGLGRRRARSERVGAIRASADASRLVVAARRISRGRARDPDAARDVRRAPERPRLTAPERRHPAPRSHYVRENRTCLRRGVGPKRLLSLTGALPRRRGVPFTEPALGRSGHFPAHGPGGHRDGRGSRVVGTRHDDDRLYCLVRRCRDYVCRGRDDVGGRSSPASL